VNNVTPIEVTHSLVNVATSSTSVLPANHHRGYFLAVNDSDTDVYLKLGTPAVAHTGILLTAYGGYYEMTVGSGNLYDGVITVIQAGSGTKRLLVTEGV